MFGRVEMRIVIDDLVAERGTREGTRAESLIRFLQRGGKARKMPCAVDVADETCRRLGAAADAVEPGGERERQACGKAVSGTVRVDDKGRPFRTSGNVGRPAYNYPLGDSEWGRDEWDPNIPG